jgi:hypothetical protein
VRYQPAEQAHTGSALDMRSRSIARKLASACDGPSGWNCTCGSASIHRPIRHPGAGGPSHSQGLVLDAVLVGVAVSCWTAQQFLIELGLWGCRTALKPLYDLRWNLGSFDTIEPGREIQNLCPSVFGGQAGWRIFLVDFDPPHIGLQ